MSREEVHKKGKYYNIIDGTFRVTVPKDHPEAEERQWEASDGTKGTKYERVVHALFGTIKSIAFHDGQYGKTVQIILDENEDGDAPIVSFGTSSRYGEDFLKRLPSIKLDEEVKFYPFTFTPEGKDKEVSGLALFHKDNEGKFTVKIPNYFVDQEAKKPTNGYPTPEGDTSTFDSDDWKAFYIKARKFLIKYAEENVIPKIATTTKKTIEYPEMDINPDDIPF